MENGISLYLVIGFASCCGGVIRGISGFGSAIIWIGIWVTFTLMGVDGGPLSLSVVTEAISSFCVAIPLLFWTGAIHGSFSWEIFGAVLLLGYVFAPIGALMLKVLDARIIELIMACILVLVLLILLEAHLFLIRAFRGQHQHNTPAAADEEEGERLINTSLVLVATPALVPPPLELDSHSSIQFKQATAAEAREERTIHQRLTNTFHTAREWCQDTFRSLSSQEGRQRLYSKWKPSLWLLMWAAIAGSASGLMNGMTGMGGPPLILLYSFMEVKKNIVRGTNACLNVFSLVRVAIYIVLGLIVADLWDVYVTGAAFHVVGVVVGNSLSSRIDQRLFGKILIGLVSICIVLLFFAAFGVT